MALSETGRLGYSQQPPDLLEVNQLGDLGCNHCQRLFRRVQPVSRTEQGADLPDLVVGRSVHNGDQLVACQESRELFVRNPPVGDALEQGARELDLRRGHHRGSADAHRTGVGAVTRIRQRGLWFEEMEVGAVYEHRPGRTVTEADNTLFTTQTMNTQALHLDAAFSSTTTFGERLVNSMFTLSTLVGLSVGQLTQAERPAQRGGEKGGGR